MRLNRLDLNQLQVLEALLAEGSATRVAEKMGLTQPAISAALRRLRDYFGDELFVQNGRQMEPTAFALTLIEPVRDMLLKAETVSRMRPAADVAALKRSVRVGVSDFVAGVLLAPVFQAAAVEAPGLRFELFSVLDSRRNYHEDLDRGEVDVLIVPELYASPDHPRRVVIDDPYVCIADARRDRTPSDLAGYLAAGHVALGSRRGVDATFDEMHLARQGLTRRIEVSVPYFMMIPQMLLGTERIATIPASLAHALQGHWPLRLFACPAPIPPMVEVMQWRAYHERDPAIAWLRAQILAAAGRAGLDTSEGR